MSPLAWLLLAAALYFCWRYFTRQGNTAPSFAWPPTGHFITDVVGESFSQPQLRHLAGNHGDESVNRQMTAVLVPYSNPHDDMAVRVEINGYAVGHLSRTDARMYRKKLADSGQGLNAASCDALINGGFIMHGGSRAHYGVRLDLDPLQK